MPTRSGPGRLRYPALRGGVVVDTVRGKTRVRKWPRARGKRLHPHTTYMNNWFRDACNKLKYADTRAIDFAIKATKGTGLYPRDVLMAGMGSGLIDLVLPDGTPITYKRQGLHPVAFQGCIVPKTANQSVTGGVYTSISWSLPNIDTAGIFNLGIPTRFTVPPGVNIVRAEVQVSCTVAGAVLTAMRLLKNGATTLADNRFGSIERGACSFDSGAIPVQNGDYLEWQVNYASARILQGGLLCRANVEILDADYPA